MIITVIVWRITKDFNAPWNASGWVIGNFIHCRLNDADDTLSVQLRDSSEVGGGSLIGSPITGPGLFLTDGGVAQRLTPDPLYAYCSTDPAPYTLKGITPQNSFPYAYLGMTLNAPQCQPTPVCDLQILDEYSVVKASGPSAADGQIQVSASSSNGTPRFSMTEDFDYATGNTTGLFTGLVPGTYTIYAKDPIGCIDTIDVTVEVSQVYNVKYRMEYDKVPIDQVPLGKGRVDILERAYAGGITEVCGGAEPFIIRVTKDLNDRYDSCIFTEAEIQILTEAEAQFIEFFEDTDDKKYQVRYYEYESNVWVLKWIGFIVPEFYSEPLMVTPFATIIKCSDNLAILQTDDFYDVNGNAIRDVSSVLTLIVQQLAKTGLQINIRSCVDIFENDMNVTDDDDPLPQAFVDPAIFYDEKKDPLKVVEVFDRLLKPFGARIFQALGVWWIVRIEKSAGTVQYREFDYEGTFIESGSISPELNLSRNYTGLPQWRDGQQRYQLTKNHGVITIRQNFGYDGNLIDSGSFEPEFVKPVGGGFYFFEGWGITLGQPGVSYGIERVDNGDSTGALFVDTSDSNSAGPSGNSTYASDTEVYSQKFRVINTGQLTLKFQYLIVPDVNMPFVRLAYRVKITSPDLATVYYLISFNGSSGFVNDSNGVDDFNNCGYKNDIYATAFGSWQNFEKTFNIPGNLDGWDMEISLFLHNGYGARIQDNDYSALKSITTSPRLQGIRRLYYYDSSAQIIRDYILDPSPATESESTPDLVEPNNYNGTTNPSRWRLQNSIRIGANQVFVNRFLIDNLSVATKIYIFDPITALVAPPEIADLKNTINVNNVNKMTEEVYLGDLPDIENAKLIYDGFFRLENGTPTASWTRKGAGEDKAIAAILLEDRSAQQKNSLRNITGVIDSLRFISYLNALRDPADGRVYVWNGYQFYSKSCMYEANLIELVTGPDGNPPPDTAEFTSEFSQEFIAAQP